MVRCAWGSRSMRHTRRPASASAAPRLTVVVVLPTPPFWFIRAIVRMGHRPWFRILDRIIGEGWGKTSGHWDERRDQMLDAWGEKKETFRRGGEGFFLFCGL